MADLKIPAALVAAGAIGLIAMALFGNGASKRNEEQSQVQAGLRAEASPDAMPHGPVASDSPASQSSSPLRLAELRRKLSSLTPWAAELRGELARLPLETQVELVTDPSINSLDAAYWAGRILHGCRMFLVNGAAHIDFEDSWCAGLASARADVKVALSLAERPAIDWANEHYLPPTDATDPESVTALLNIVAGDNLDHMSLWLEDLVASGAARELGVEIPLHILSSPAASSRIGRAAGVLLACQAEAHCGWSSPWMGWYCSGNGIGGSAVCNPQLSLDQQVALNSNSHEQRVIQELIAAVTRFRSSKGRRDG